MSICTHLLLIKCLRLTQTWYWKYFSFKFLELRENHLNPTVQLYTLSGGIIFKKKQQMRSAMIKRSKLYKRRSRKCLQTQVSPVDNIAVSPTTFHKDANVILYLVLWFNETDSWVKLHLWGMSHSNKTHQSKRQSMESVYKKIINPALQRWI